MEKKGRRTLDRLNRLLTKLVPVHFFIEAYEYERPDAKQGRTKISRGSKHGRDCIRAQGGSALVPHHVLSFHDNHLVCCCCDGFRIVSLKLFTGRDFLSNLKFTGLYELRGSYTARSAIAVVMPIDLSVLAH